MGIIIHRTRDTCLGQMQRFLGIVCLLPARTASNLNLFNLFDLVHLIEW